MKENALTGTGGEVWTIQPNLLSFGPKTTEEYVCCGVSKACPKGPVSRKILLRKRFSDLLCLKVPDCSNTVNRFKCILLDESPGEEKQMVA